MKTPSSFVAGDVKAEVPALIEILHASAQRLEELTAGEVDTVADHHGRPFLLRRAQDHLRQHETAKQVAILNALPAHIALLDAQGRILLVNAAWRRFASANRLQGQGFGIGLNYLAICDRARGDDAAEAAPAATGIRAVLAGDLDRFALEYACHSASVQRWFLMTVTPLSAGSPAGAVVMHLDITARKRGEEELLRFIAAIDALADAIYLVDRASMCFVHVNDAACRMQSQTRAQLLALRPEQMLLTSRAELERTYDAIIASGVDAKPQEMLRHRADGSSAWVELRRHAQRSGGRWTIVTLVRDITERKEAENRIRRLNRVYAVLSGINALIVRVHSRDELFREACRIAVEAGAFKLAWIGVIDPQTRDGKVVAWYGAEQGFIDDIRLTVRDGLVENERPACRALRLGQPVICNEIATEPSLAALKDELLGRGYQSLGCFPLSLAGQPEAVIALFAGEPGFFNSEEMQLLLELAGDLSFALDHIEKEAKLNYLAYYDVLTGLANRSLFLERVAQHLHSALSDGSQVAVFLIDLERFKNINDSLGRPAGDELLRQIAQWLTRSVGSANVLARVGADHFAVVLPEVRPEGSVMRLIEKMMASFLEHPFRLNDAVFRVAAKVGVAFFPEDGADADILFRNAEAALKKAKASGERYLFYTQNMTEAVAARLTLENQLRQALDNGEFVLHYQPKVNLASGKLTSVEALIRWNDPRTGLVPPGQFIPILEETGLIYEVGRWAMRQAIADYLRWRAAGLAAVRIAVNVSSLQLRHRGFIAEVRDAIGVDVHAPGGLELEITESLIMEDVKHSIVSLQAIRAMGVSIAIDDFGTGFSSLSYLSKFPVDTLKIDRSFVLDMTTGPEGLALVSTIITLAHALKLKVVAEGVETEEQSRLLHVLNCDEIQGYVFSPPVPGEVFEANYLARLPARDD